MSVLPGLQPNWDPTREQLASFGKAGFVVLFVLAVAVFALAFFGVLPLSYEAAATFAVVFAAMGAFSGLCGVAVPHTLTSAHLLANTLYWPLSFLLRLVFRAKPTDAASPQEKE